MNRDVIPSRHLAGIGALHKLQAVTKPPLDLLQATTRVPTVVHFKATSASFHIQIGPMELRQFCQRCWTLRTRRRWGARRRDLTRLAPHGEVLRLFSKIVLILGDGDPDALGTNICITSEKTIIMVTGAGNVGAIVSIRG